MSSATRSSRGPRIGETVRVSLGPRSYDVLIGAGLLPRAADLISARLGEAKCAIVTDENVAKCQLASLQQALQAAGRHLGTEVLPAGEASKSFPALSRLCEALLQMGLERGDLVIALGGGVIGDLAGLAASLVRRGARLVQVPTTLLAQVDASVGGKTAINTPQGKNLIGTFHQPSLVLADIDALATLPDRQFRAGYVEAAKFGLLADADFFQWLEHSCQAVLAKEWTALVHLLGVSVKGKAEIVARDETETGDRMLLNLGHTFGHALEAWAGYSDKLLHGEAIAIGICLAFQLSEQLGYIGKDSVMRVQKHFADMGVPTRVGDIQSDSPPDADTLIGTMRQDKKVRRGALTLILARGIGEAFVTRDIDVATVSEFLSRALDQQR